jgi:hypothetical protein
MPAESKNSTIKTIIDSQNVDGGWGISEGYESDILDSCLILKELMKNNGFDEEIHAAVNYLISVQNQDGSWGLLPETAGSVYATALVRTELFTYNEKFRANIFEVLEKSSQWLLGVKNADGMWGDAEDTIYLSTFVYKALNADKWQDVKSIPKKITLLQMANGSWDNNPYWTSLVLDMLNLDKENSKVELKDVKILVNGLEATGINAKDVIEIVPVYTGLLPIVDLARYAALVGGIRAIHTLDRLRAAADQGVLRREVARVLEEAFELFSALRLEHQVTQIEQGREPDDMLDPEEIDPLTRRYLRDAFREVAAVQKTFAGRLEHR